MNPEPTDAHEERMILVFDFETTGLPKQGNAKYSPGSSKQEEWPHAVQLAYILYDKQTGSSKIVNEIVRLPEGVSMTAESEAVHHISADSTRHKTEEGVSLHKEIEYVLKEFIVDFRRADIIVAHNIHFDRNMLLVELDRLHQKGKQEFTAFLDEFYKNNIEYCTALKGKYVCKTEKVDKFGRMYYKMPKLVELYHTLFGVHPDEAMLHNALVDVVICFRCFYKMRYNEDIYTSLHSTTEIKSILDNLHIVSKINNFLEEDQEEKTEMKQTRTRRRSQKKR